MKNYYLCFERNVFFFFSCTLIIILELYNFNDVTPYTFYPYPLQTIQKMKNLSHSFACIIVKISNKKTWKRRKNCSVILNNIPQGGKKKNKEKILSKNDKNEVKKLFLYVCSAPEVFKNKISKKKITVKWSSLLLLLQRKEILWMSWKFIF